MVKGLSGRVVVEPGVELKMRLYAALEGRGVTLKDWFCEQAQSVIEQVGTSEGNSKRAARKAGSLSKARK